MLRVYLLGEMCVLGSGAIVRAPEFPSGQVRHAFAYLALERHRFVEREELTRAVWPNGDAPLSRDLSLSVVISRLRTLLGRLGLDARSTITTLGGCYGLRLPSPSWVDVEEALRSLHEAEGALLRGEPAQAYPASVIASSILRRPFLPGAQATWVEGRRADLQAALLRALDAVIRCLEWSGDLALALKNAETMVELAPLRESSYRHLMRLHAKAGNRAEALNAYHRCRMFLAEEAGVSPCSETEAIYLRLLRDA